MHSGPVRKGDDWLRRHVRLYVKWARRHNSLLILTWDEGSGDNHIATIIAGAHVRRGQYDQPINHYDLLRTVEDLYDLPHAAASADAEPITGVFV